MALEQTVKDFQAQNAQFQKLFLNLAKGKEELNSLITKEKKEKIKKPVGILNMGRRLKGPVKRALEFEEENDDQEEDDKSMKADNQGSDEEEANYSDEQYPLADDKYKQLEDSLNVMEIQRVPGLDFEDLGLILGVMIPHKFKIPSFAKYDGVLCPKLHLWSYV